MPNIFTVNSEQGIYKVDVFLGLPKNYKDGTPDLNNIDSSAAVKIENENIVELEIKNILYPYFLHGHITFFDVFADLGKLIGDISIICKIVIVNKQSNNSSIAHSFLVSSINSVYVDNRFGFKINFESIDAISFNGILKTPVSTYKNQKSVQTLLSSIFPENVGKLKIDNAFTSKNIQYISKLNSTYIDAILDLITYLTEPTYSPTYIIYNLKSLSYELFNMDSVKNEYYVFNAAKISNIAGFEFAAAFSGKNFKISSKSNFLNIFKLMSRRIFNKFNFSKNNWELTNQFLTDNIIQSTENILPTNIKNNKLYKSYNIGSNSDILSRYNQKYYFPNYDTSEYFKYMQDYLCNMSTIEVSVVFNSQRNIGDVFALQPDTNISKINSLYAYIGNWKIIGRTVYIDKKLGIMDKLILIRPYKVNNFDYSKMVS